MSVLPGFVPGVLISVVVALAAGGAVGRVLYAGRVIGTCVLAALGLILSATLTPFTGASSLAVTRGTCDLAHALPYSAAAFVHSPDAVGNVALFMPLGLAVGLLPRSQRKALVLVAAIALPAAIETTQMLVPALNRTCEAADVVSNVAGLALGVIAGAIAGWRST